MSVSHAAQSDKSTLLKIWEFPLVALIVGLAAIVGVVALASWLFSFLPTTGTLAYDQTIRTVLVVAAVYIVYKLVIPRLGAHKKDDLPFAGSLTDTVLGVAVGAAIFTTVVGVAAAVGAYRILGCVLIGYRKR